MKTKDELAAEYIAALHAEIRAWKYGISRLQDGRHFPTGDAMLAVKASDESAVRYNQRLQEEQLNATTP